MPIEEDLFEKLRVELRRGSLVLAVLGALREERYGYTLRASLEEAGLPIDEGALYPLLRRLEALGPAHQRMARGGRSAISASTGWRPVGARRCSRQLLAEWNAISESILRLTGRTSDGPHRTLSRGGALQNLPAEAKADDIIAELARPELATRSGDPRG